MQPTILYNPKCGTCRNAKEILEKKGYAPVCVEYLKTPPSIEELDSICKKLNLEPQQVAREKEPVYEEVASRCKTRSQWLKALHDHPVLIQRPIVILGNRALIARPADLLIEWLSTSH